MKRFVLTMLSMFLSLPFLLINGQGIRATGDKMPVVSQTATTGTPTTYTGRQVMVGSGGGFTGFSTTYCLLDNGKLFGRRSRDTTFTFIGRQTTANTKRVFSIAEETCKIKTARFDNPGNTYTFIRWKKGRKENKVSWGAAGVTVPASYKKFYNSFMAMIPVVSRMK
ncbi:FAD-binding oxidoreductase [Spirosoma pollinicola]|nr:FAD-binding oxidoreductase [Spirosoma pollinicola]